MVTPEEQVKRDKERESKKAKESLKKTQDELLEEIFFISQDQLSHNPTTIISRTVAFFSSLLIKLSHQAEESTKQNIALQNKITNLTRWLLIATIALLLLAFLQLCSK